MADPKIASVTVKYTEDGSTKKRDIKFKGNFGFKIDGKTYRVENGRVLNEKGQEVNAFRMPTATAYQFIGMSHCAESAADDTYSAKDIAEAQAYHDDSYGFSRATQNNIPLADAHSINIIGNGAGKVVTGSTQVKDGVYTTQYISNSTGKVSTVSVWLAK